jgi:hypothetical protein
MTAFITCLTVKRGSAAVAAPAAMKTKMIQLSIFKQVILFFAELNMIVSFLYKSEYKPFASSQQGQSNSTLAIRLNILQQTCFNPDSNQLIPKIIRWAITDTHLETC